MRVCMWPGPLLSVPQKEVSALGSKKKCVFVCDWDHYKVFPKKRCLLWEVKKNAVFVCDWDRERCPLRDVKNVQFVCSWDQNVVSGYGRRPSSEIQLYTFLVHTMNCSNWRWGKGWQIHTNFLSLPKDC